LFARNRKKNENLYVVPFRAARPNKRGCCGRPGNTFRAPGFVATTGHPHSGRRLPATAKKTAWKATPIYFVWFCPCSKRKGNLSSLLSPSAHIEQQEILISRIECRLI
jgi:hypothetical protein